MRRRMYIEEGIVQQQVGQVSMVCTKGYLTIFGKGDATNGPSGMDNRQLPRWHHVFGDANIAEGRVQRRCQHDRNATKIIEVKVDTIRNRDGWHIE